MAATVQVAFVGIFTTLLTTTGVIVVAIINNRKERGQAAESAMERTLRERIILRDEQIADLKADLAERDRVIEQQAEELRLLKEGRL